MNENILNFPTFTIYNKVMPKKAFYSHLEANAQMKSLFVEYIEQIVWLYKLAPSNLHIADGKEVQEIDILRIKLKQKTKSFLEICRFIDSLSPHHTLFIIEHGAEYQLLVNYKQWKDAKAGTFDIIKTFQSDWVLATSLKIQLDALSSMDSLYESLVRQVASSQITSSKQDLHQAVIETKEAEAIKKEMESIKKREARERQPQKKFALHQEYLRLKAKLVRL